MAFDLSCDWKSGFVMDPSKKSRVGYLVHLNGMDMGEFLKQDITVFTPYSNSETKYSEVTINKEKGTATVVGVLEQFSWAGGVGDPIAISAYISAENALTLQAKMKTTLTTTKVSKLAWWICNFDEENKIWYEEAFPIAPVTVTGQINAPGGKDIRLHVSEEPTKVAPNIDINVYNLYLEVIPAANATCNFSFASSSKTNYVKNWGLVVGTNATAAMGS